MKRVFQLLLAVGSILGITHQSWALLSQELETIVVTASRSEEESYRLAGNVSVLTGEQIKATNAQTIPDVLSYALGVNVYDNSTAKSAVVDIRGFGETSLSNVLVMVDGRRINAVDLSGPDLVQIPIDSVDRIEIIRGGGSVLYGDNAVGGVVNIITKKGEGDLHGYVGGTYGSYGANSANTQVSGSKNGFSFYLFNQYLDDRGFRDHSDLLAKDYDGRFGYNWKDKIKTGLDVGWHEDVQELPGGLKDSELASLGRRASVNPLDTSFTTDRYAKLSLNFSPWLREQYWGDFIVDLHYRNRDVYDEFNGDGSFPFHTKRNIYRTGGTAKYIFDHTVFGKEVNFVTGVDLYDTQNDIKGSAFNSDDITITKKELGVFGFLQYELYENLFVNGGTRYHQADYTFDQRNNGPSYLTTRPDEWVSMGGLKYEYAKGSNVHFNVEQTFRFLATDEWYSSFTTPPSLNLDLDQQRGIQYEVGIKHNFDDKVIFSATPYLILLKHEIFYDPSNFKNSNYDETRRVGVETGAKVDILEFMHVDFLNKLEVFTNFTYQDAEQTSGPNKGKKIPFVSAEELSAGIIAGFFKNYTFSLLGRGTGSRYAISDQANETPPVKPYFTLDSKLTYERNNFELFVGVDNLTNEKYYSYVSKQAGTSVRSWFPAPDRNFNAGVKLKF